MYNSYVDESPIAQQRRESVYVPIMYPSTANGEDIEQQLSLR